MVGAGWPELSSGLDRGIEQLYHIGEAPLFNGLFAVGKGEFALANPLWGR